MSTPSWANAIAAGNIITARNHNADVARDATDSSPVNTCGSHGADTATRTASTVAAASDNRTARDARYRAVATAPRPRSSATSVWAGTARASSDSEMNENRPITT